MKYTNVAIGADPELFLVDNNGHYKSAIGLIGGSKQSPRKIDSFGNAVQEDNVAVEFNIRPAKTKEEFSNSIEKVLRYLSDFVGKKNLFLAIDASAFFGEDQLQDIKALTFGCDPDFCVWTRKINPTVELTEETYNLRSAGGHIHVSWEGEINIEDQERLVKAMDIFCGAPAIQLDKDYNRRKLYGKAGCFRKKYYGIEYRTLSNFWIASPDLVDWAYTQTNKAIDFLNNDGKIDDNHYEIIADCINNGNEASLIKLQQYYPV